MEPPITTQPADHRIPPAEEFYFGTSGDSSLGIDSQDGVIEPRDAGTPQGGVISPILANLFLHYAFDMWMARTHPAVPFERYADDAICHCRTRDEAEALQAALQERFASCRLVLHPQKTRIVYCKDTNRSGTYPIVTFDFLGSAPAGRSDRPARLAHEDFGASKGNAG
jgi:hypothetical protein